MKSKNTEKYDRYIKFMNQNILILSRPINGFIDDTIKQFFMDWKNTYSKVYMEMYSIYNRQNKLNKNNKYCYILSDN